MKESAIFMSSNVLSSTINKVVTNIKMLDPSLSLWSVLHHRYLIALFGIKDSIEKGKKIGRRETWREEKKEGKK